MKHSRLFLGMTTCFLAIAGVVAAKATHFGQSHNVRYINSIGACVTAQAFCITSATAVNTCITNAITKKPFYTYNASKTCVTPLKYTQL